MESIDKRAERFANMEAIPGDEELSRGISDYMPRASGRWVDRDGISYKPLVILGIITAALTPVAIIIMYMS
jgi:hypothetical protein